MSDLPKATGHALLLTSSPFFADKRCAFDRLPIVFPCSEKMGQVSIHTRGRLPIMRRQRLAFHGRLFQAAVESCSRNDRPERKADHVRAAGELLREDRRDMTKKNLRIGLYTLIFLVPILGMMNCHGWSTLDGEVKGCFIDLSFTRSFANFSYAFIFFSAFLLGIPILVYALLGVGLVELIIWIWGKTSKAKEKHSPHDSAP